MKGYLDGVHWVHQHGLHLTIKFLGDVNSARIDDISGAMETTVAQFKPFLLSFGSAGVFPAPQKTRVLWIGVKDGAKQVQDIAQILDTALGKCGFTVERRKYVPHLTIGRLRYPLSIIAIERYLEQEKTFSSNSVHADGIVLIQSNLSRSGATYITLQKLLFR